MIEHDLHIIMLSVHVGITIELGLQIIMLSVHVGIYEASVRLSVISTFRTFR
jgi:hypothetical protein